MFSQLQSWALGRHFIKSHQTLKLISKLFRLINIIGEQSDKMQGVSPAGGHREREMTFSLTKSDLVWQASLGLIKT